MKFLKWAGTILSDWLREIVVVAFLALSAILSPPEFWKRLWQTLSAVYEVPLWLCILAWTPVIAWIVFLIGRYRIRAYERKFTELEIDGLIWKWQYENHLPTKPIPYCPRRPNGTICKTELIVRHDPETLITNFRCPACNNDPHPGIFGTPDVADEEFRKIKSHIENGSWKARLKDYKKLKREIADVPPVASAPTREGLP